MLPLAHVGHYLWVFYLVPVVIVIGGIVYSAISGKREQPAAEGGRSAPPASDPRDSPSAGDDPPSG